MPPLIMAGRPVGPPRPKKWKTLGGYSDDEFRKVDIAFTTAENAIRTANWIRKHGIRRASRLIVGDSLFAEDVGAQYRNKLALVRELKRIAKEAKRNGGVVAFATETGGYPWRGTPFVWIRGR
jgi:hypothetical protein